jgi:hypothetical protein
LKTSAKRVGGAKAPSYIYRIKIKVMRIIMEKRKGGFYAQWYNIAGIDPQGQRCNYLIYANQANTYAKAVRFFNETWGSRGHIGITLRNAEPFGESLWLAA